MHGEGASPGTTLSVHKHENFHERYYKRILAFLKVGNCTIGVVTGCAASAWFRSRHSSTDFVSVLWYQGEHEAGGHIVSALSTGLALLAASWQQTPQSVRVVVCTLRKRLQALEIR